MFKAKITTEMIEATMKHFTIDAQVIQQESDGEVEITPVSDYEIESFACASFTVEERNEQWFAFHLKMDKQDRLEYVAALSAAYD